VAVVRGIVRTDQGDPVAEARVHFSRGPVPLPDIAALTDDQGSFAVTAPAPGRYELTVSAGERTVRQPLEIAPEQQSVDVAIVIETSGPR